MPALGVSGQERLMAPISRGEHEVEGDRSGAAPPLYARLRSKAAPCRPQHGLDC